MKEDVLRWLSELEKERGVGPDGVTSKCLETGGAYDIVSWHIDVHGVARPVWCRFEKHEYVPLFFVTEDIAWAAWQTAFEQYLIKRKGKIYWRVYPEIALNGELRPTIYSRVSVAAKPGNNGVLTKDLPMTTKEYIKNKFVFI